MLKTTEKHKNRQQTPGKTVQAVSQTLLLLMKSLNKTETPIF